MSPVPGKKHTMVIYADWSTAGTNQLRVYGPDESTIVSSMMAGPKTIAGKNDFLYSNLMDPNPPQNPYFAMSFFNGSGVSFWQMSCYRLYYPTNSSRPTIGCSIGYVIDESLVPFLNSVRVTNNTIVLLLEKATGLLVSTNRRDSIAFNNTIRVTPNLSLNKDVSILGRGLLAHFGNFSLIPNDTAGNGAVWQRKMEDGQEWFLSTAIINVRGTEFVLAIGFPRSDMFSKIDSAERQGLIIAISVAVAGLLLTGSLTFLALRPLHKMAIAMKQLTKFDFSSLENGALEKRSLMSEIREVESVFDTMVVAFASAIKRNKQLVGNTAVSSTGQKSSMMNSTSK
ncbi:hypothetical protein BC829DRAFT_402047 [Chytridium lagenaria]|nr:hypothetical protein BC829DRAFT_402047 [Chytridium lagenaria]